MLEKQQKDGIKDLILLITLTKLTSKIGKKYFTSSLDIRFNIVFHFRTKGRIQRRQGYSQTFLVFIRGTMFSFILKLTS